jgi:hypothetical protein
MSYMEGDKFPIGGIQWIGDWMRALTIRMIIDNVCSGLLDRMLKEKNS